MRMLFFGIVSLCLTLSITMLQGAARRPDTPRAPVGGALTLVGLVRGKGRSLPNNQGDVIKRLQEIDLNVACKIGRDASMPVVLKAIENQCRMELTGAMSAQTRPAASLEMIIRLREDEQFLKQVLAVLPKLLLAERACDGRRAASGRGAAVRPPGGEPDGRASTALTYDEVLAAERAKKFGAGAAGFSAGTFELALAEERTRQAPLMASRQHEEDARHQAELAAAADRRLAEARHQAELVEARHQTELAKAEAAAKLAEAKGEARTAAVLAAERERAMHMAAAVAMAQSSQRKGGRGDADFFGDGRPTGGPDSKSRLKTDFNFLGIPVAGIDVRHASWDNKDKTD